MSLPLLRGERCMWYFGLKWSAFSAAETSTACYTITSCDLYCKHITILNDVCRVNRMMLHIGASPMIVILMTLEAPMIITLLILEIFYSTGIIYDHHLRLSKYFNGTGYWWYTPLTSLPFLVVYAFIILMSYHAPSEALSLCLLFLNQLDTFGSCYKTFFL